MISDIIFFKSQKQIVSLYQLMHVIATHNDVGSFLADLHNEKKSNTLNSELCPSSYTGKFFASPFYYLTDHTHFKVYVYKHFVVFLMLLAS